MAAHRIFDVSTFAIVSTPRTEFGSVDGPGSVRKLSRYSLNDVSYNFTYETYLDHLALEDSCIDMFITSG